MECDVKAAVSVGLSSSEIRGKEEQAGTRFISCDPGCIDLEQRTLQTIDNPFGTRL
jgi:hypothetical protein